jgi:hypothetical protein
MTGGTLKKQVRHLWQSISKYLPMLFPLGLAAGLAWIGVLLLSLDVYGFESRFRDFHEALTKQMTSDDGWESASWRLAIEFVSNEPVIVVLWIGAAVSLLVGFAIGIIRREQSELNPIKSGKVISWSAALVSLALASSLIAPSLLVTQLVNSNVLSAERVLKGVIRDQDDIIEDLSDDAELKSTQSLVAFNNLYGAMNKKNSAKLECLRSPNSRTYFSSDSFLIESGFYNNCTLAEFLERKWDLIDEPNLQAALDKASADSASSQKALETANGEMLELESQRSEINSQLRSLDRAEDRMNSALFLSALVFLLSTLSFLAFSFSREVSATVVGEAKRMGRISRKLAQKIQKESRSSRCPHCAERVKQEAKICRHCQSAISGITKKQ